MKRILIISIYLLAAISIVFYSSEIYSHYFLTKLVAAPPPPSIGGEVGPVKFYINEDTPWQSIAKLMVVILGTHLGIKTINKYIK